MTSTILPALAKLDPAEAWQPWSPDAANPWNLKWAAHLYRRTAFGAPAYAEGVNAWDALQKSVAQGFDATLEQLFKGGPGQGDFDAMLDALAPKIGKGPRFDFQPDAGLNEIQAWWTYRFLFSPHPLQEKMTLLWHNHFATSAAKVKNSGLMLRQNQLIRRHALGKFQPLLLGMSKDPAMLVWLDSNANVKSHPNENFAREVMELFSLGVGNYTETDIREAARAFTGWHSAGTEYLFNPAQHDDGEKNFLKQKGNWDGGDVVRILLEQPAAARFLVRKLYRNLISENEVAPEALIEPLAEQLRKTEYDLGQLVRTMLRSRLFFSQHAYRQRIKSPAEFVVGVARMLDLQIGPGNLATSMTDLGQKLFAPPNVKGWDGGKAWLNSGTMLGRHNLAWDLINSGKTSPHPDISGGIQQSPPVPDDPRRHHWRASVAFVEQYGGKDPASQVGFLLDFALQGDVPKAAREKLTGFLKEQTPMTVNGEKPAAHEERLRETLHTILLLPEYQLA